MSGRTWKFVVNNWTVEDRKLFENLDVNLIVFGEELGEQGTPHLQGHITFKRTYRLAALKKIHKTAHWEPAKCQDFNYELKGENVFIKDNRKQGDRSDLKKTTKLVLNNTPMREVAREYPETFVRYGKGLVHLSSICIIPRDGTIIPEVTVLYGKTGTGKSYTARQMLKDYYVWTPARGQWFDGYTGQNEVIFEEFRGQLPLGMLLLLLDRYECPVQYKGGMTEFSALKIVITSPCHPRHWYEKCENEEVLEQLMRRITLCRQV